jgi:elongation factor Ts
LDIMSSDYRLIESYVHNGRIGVLIELGYETSVTGLVPEVAQLAKDLAMHVAASNPKTIEDLLLQPFVKETTVTVGRLLSDISKRLGEHVFVRRFVRWDSPTPSPLAPPPSPPRLRGA